MKHEFQCHQCNEDKVHESDLSTGYATDKDGHKICFACCGLNDANELEELLPKERFVLYMDTKDKTLSNWPGTFKIPLHYIKEGRHNMAGKRYDTWFTFRHGHYHAVQYGDNTQIAHVRRISE